MPLSAVMPARSPTCSARLMGVKVPQRCYGMLTDGDLAARLGRDLAEVGNRRSVRYPIASHTPPPDVSLVFQGTLPFMSTELIISLTYRDHRPHTPLDDLESFMYVLLWAGMKYLRSRDKLSPREQNLFTGLQAHKPRDLINARKDFFICLEKAFSHRPEFDLSPAFRPLGELVYLWHKLLLDPHTQIARTHVAHYYEQARAKELIIEHKGLRACYAAFLNMPYQVDWTGDEQLSPELEQEWSQGSPSPQP
jgi:Fungal protein kinase